MDRGREGFARVETRSAYVDYQSRSLRKCGSLHGIGYSGESGDAQHAIACWCAKYFATRVPITFPKISLNFFTSISGGINMRITVG